MSRLPVSRWAKIGVWTGAAVAWGTTLLVARQAATPPADAANAAPGDDASATAATASQAPLPTLPSGGLVVLRYTPVPDPEPLVVTRYVQSATPSAATGSSGGTTGSGGSTTVAPAPPPSSSPAPTTAAPRPTSGGS